MSSSDLKNEFVLLRQNLVALCQEITQETGLAPSTFSPEDWIARALLTVRTLRKDLALARHKHYPLNMHVEAGAIEDGTVERHVRDHTTTIYRPRV